MICFKGEMIKDLSSEIVKQTKVCADTFKECKGMEDEAVAYVARWKKKTFMGDFMMLLTPAIIYLNGIREPITIFMSSLQVPHSFRRRWGHLQTGPSDSGHAE